MKKTKKLKKNIQSKFSDPKPSNAGFRNTSPFQGSKFSGKVTKSGVQSKPSVFKTQHKG